MHSPNPSRAARRGFTLIELMVVLAIVVVGVAMFARTLASAARLDPVAEETAAAAAGARVALETIRNHPKADAFVAFDDDPANDPGGAGTAPGSRFDVAGLKPLAPGERVGRILFPVIDGMLREDVVDRELGMPRDLNGDGTIDSLDHSLDFLVLPVRLRLEWASRTGQKGKRNLVVYAMLSKL